MKTLVSKIWSLVDGKKTLLGLLVIALTILDSQVPGALTLLAEAVKQALESEQGQVGAALALIGLGDKVRKAVK